ncbi:hypothetical protein K469DRAFT_357641 [Zopfia rhizophila CBS 207.26]|uniref:Rhodopsin domain-containing protein n=1 Tax=Zopfia rhizophila CBS 207.26 TaxID=1314779 RepID=A0A6A6DEJ9_9PEZI|nr:hypothetical protein K469DRAFT_357641 [Zopfia rhizophila CBS 207.26]
MTMTESSQIGGMPHEFWTGSRVSVLIGAQSLFIFLTIISILLRFYARVFSRSHLWWDDWLALATVPFALVPPVLDIVSKFNGLGKYRKVSLKTTSGKVETYSFKLYILLLFYNAGLALFKYSFLAFYIRVFPVINWVRRFCYTLAVIITIWVLANSFALIFRCTPVSASWNPNEATTCIDLRHIYLSQSIPTICFDIAILFLPIRLVCNAGLRRADRLGVIAVFGFGGLVTVISITRLAVILSENTSGFSWTKIQIGILSSAEPVTGLLCCCMLTYAPLVRGLFRKVNGTSSPGETDETRMKGDQEFGAFPAEPEYVDSTPFGSRAGTPIERACWVEHEPSRNSSRLSILELIDFGYGAREDDRKRGEHSREASLGGIQVTQEIVVQR